LDKYLVTVGRFRQFVAAWDNGSGYMPTAGAGKHTHLNAGQGLANSGSPGTYETGWDEANWNNSADVNPTSDVLACYQDEGTWTDVAGANELLPINCVIWYEAYAFCIWDGGFLPSEVEWEYAAAGGSEQRPYPWGSTAPGTVCPGTGCDYAIYDCDYPAGTGSCSGASNIAPVGTASAGAGRWGQLDLAGDLYEWTLDWDAPYVTPCSDCAYLTALSSSDRTIRGGYFQQSGALQVPAARAETPPTYRISSIGFRCARTPY
jgi:formylglycine-generating enzyme required for sulfatase activity